MLSSSLGVSMRSLDPARGVRRDEKWGHWPRASICAHTVLQPQLQFVACICAVYCVKALHKAASPSGSAACLAAVWPAVSTQQPSSCGLQLQYKTQIQQPFPDTSRSMAVGAGEVSTSLSVMELLFTACLLAVPRQHSIQYPCCTAGPCRVPGLVSGSSRSRP